MTDLASPGMIARMNPQTHDSNAADPLQDVVTAAEAARLTGRGRATIQRTLQAGEFPNATKGDEGWQIPLQDLVDAGFDLDRTQTEPESTIKPPRMPNDVDALKTQLRIARDKLTIESAARRNAEQLAEERAQHIKDLRGLVDVVLARSTPRAG